MREYPSLIGERFGKLTVVEQLPSTSAGQRRWLCKCDCGGEHIATTGNLRSGRTTKWECRCECGAITYKATDTLTNPDESMCLRCLS